MDAFWSHEPDDVFRELGATGDGLSSAEAAARLRRFGPNALRARKRLTRAGVLLGQFKSPLVLLLLGAAILSMVLGDVTDAVIILAIVIGSALLSFFQEYSAGDAVRKLMALVQTRANVARDGKTGSVPLEEVVPGDVVLLAAGSIVPGDGLLLADDNLFVNEAALTGESFPVEKEPGAVAADTALAQRHNTLFSGTNVVSGTGRMVVVQTGRETEFGRIAERLQLRPPETEFERGIRRFGYLLIEFTGVLTLAVFAINVLLKRPPLDSFLFALALAVGLTPQLLPAIISVNLARGAREMARVKVIVKRLASIENFGSMSVLCSDKTGTLTEGVVHVHGAYHPDGTDSPEALRFAELNASLQAGFPNPIDEALVTASPPDLKAEVELADELPYDFLRKRLSIVVRDHGQTRLITKGALEPVLQVCAHVRLPDGSDVPVEQARAQIMAQFATYGQQGLRVLGVAVREMAEAPKRLTALDEADMVFVGFLVLEDPLRPDIVQTVRELRDLGIALKMITGDNRLVAAHAAAEVGLNADRILTGPDLRHLTDDALVHQVAQVDVFAEVEPNQKERLIMAFRKAGFVVGYIGDGINDGAALHTADVSISVASAVDVAKEAADLVMLESGLGVLVGGVREGRRTFANTLKYVFMASSANFGNMFSMAGASLLMPFLPLLPKQILLMNLMTDLPEMTIAADNVDLEQVAQPRRWDVGLLRRFMLIFGPLSSIFDYMTFGALWLMTKEMHGSSLHAATFRTGWFMESIISAAMIVLVIRSQRPFFRSQPARPLVWATLAVVAATLALPYTPLARPLGFQPLPLGMVAAMLGIVVLYILAAEMVKRRFYWTGGTNRKAQTADIRPQT